MFALDAGLTQEPAFTALTGFQVGEAFLLRELTGKAWARALSLRSAKVHTYLSRHLLVRRGA